MSGFRSRSDHNRVPGIRPRTATCGFAAFRISYWDFAGWIVAAAFAAMSLGYLLSEPFPFWMRLSAVAVPFIGALFAFGTYRRWRAAHLHLDLRR